ncbi:MAG: TolC family protein, partial [Ferruginibacter sp.]
ENALNVLLARVPGKVTRTTLLEQVAYKELQTGLPSQLLKNRPDIRQAETELQATNWDLKTAQKEFYPSLELSATLGLQAFKPAYLYKLPESLAFSLLGELAGPIINRKAIIAEYKTANAYQIEAMYEYQKAILNGVVEVTTELSNISNLQNKYSIKSKEVDALTRSVEIAGELYKSARANYLEVLTAQRDALSSKLELVEIKKDQYLAQTNVYKALGGGWR